MVSARTRVSMEKTNSVHRRTYTNEGAESQANVVVPTRRAAVDEGQVVQRVLHPASRQRGLTTTAPNSLGQYPQQVELIDHGFYPTGTRLVHVKKAPEVIESVNPLQRNTLVPQSQLAPIVHSSPLVISSSGFTAEGSNLSYGSRQVLLVEDGNQLHGRNSVLPPQSSRFVEMASLGSVRADPVSPRRIQRRFEDPSSVLYVNRDVRPQQIQDNAYMATVQPVQIASSMQVRHRNDQCRSRGKRFVLVEVPEDNGSSDVTAFAEPAADRYSLRSPSQLPVQHSRYQQVPMQDPRIGLSASIEGTRVGSVVPNRSHVQISPFHTLVPSTTVPQLMTLPESRDLNALAPQPPIPTTSYSGSKQKSRSLTKKRKKSCHYPRCVKYTQGGTNFCIAHGGGKRCAFSGCGNSANSSTRFCISHGGGKRCNYPACKTSARGNTRFCINHGGGRRCVVLGCKKAALSFGNTCKEHGGGRRCAYAGCSKTPRSRTAFCVSHGGGKRCNFEGCSKSAVGKTSTCIQHGGGKRCITPACTKSAILPGDRCVAHGGGRRCREPGCKKAARSALPYCRKCSTLRAKRESEDVNGAPDMKRAKLNVHENDAGVIASVADPRAEATPPRKAQSTG